MNLIRPEMPGDVDAIRRIVSLAFERDVEADLVDALRRNDAATVSLVAMDGDMAVGHILFSPARVGTADRFLEIAGMAPVSVLPSHQRMGIGGQLIRAGLEACRRLAIPAVIVLGHPAYYPRFGFTRASQYGIRCEFDAPEEAFMAMELQEGALTGWHGAATYRPEFNDF